MSGRFKMPSVEELLSKKKNKKAKGKEVEKGKEIEESVEEAIADRKLTAHIPLSTGGAQTKKRKSLIDPEVDMDTTIVKIPYGTTVISDPSGLSGFVGGLLLEEDENRLNALGPVEASKRAVARAYEVLECTLHSQRLVETSHKRIRDLEKSNAALRKELTELKASAEVSQKKAAEALEAAESTLKLEREVSAAERDALNEAVRNLRKENDELVEQIEGVGLEVMLRERGTLMKEYVEGKHEAWTPTKWIKMLEKIEAGLPLSDDEEDVTEVVVGATEDKVTDVEGKLEAGETEKAATEEDPSRLKVEGPIERDLEAEEA